VEANIKVILEGPNKPLNEKYLGLPSDFGRSKNRAYGYLKDADGSVF
jgi:hypothetical protein